MIKDKCDRKEPDPIIPLESTAHLHTTFFRLKEQLVCNREDTLLFSTSASLTKFHLR
jgi:hypothetical protein